MCHCVIVLRAMCQSAQFAVLQCILAGWASDPNTVVQSSDYNVLAVVFGFRLQ